MLSGSLSRFLPSRRLPMALKMSGSMPYLMLCTEPSANTALVPAGCARSEEHTSELQSQFHLVCRLLLEKKKNRKHKIPQLATSKLTIPTIECTARPPDSIE